MPRPGIVAVRVVAVAVAMAMTAMTGACGSPSPSAPAPETETEAVAEATTTTTAAELSRLRVMTWNLQRGQAVAGPLAAADMGPFAALVVANRAEVVGLQEVTREQAEALTAALGWPGPAYVETKQPCPGFPPPLPASCVPFGNALVSRFPVGPIEHWVLPPSRLEASLEDRVLLRAVVDVAGRRLAVYVTHLAANATESEREAQVEAALTHVDDDPRPVLLGDFNAEPTDDVVRRVTARFVDAWAEARAGQPGPTSNAVLGLSRRIDYVFVGRDSGLRVTDAHVDPAVLSDHLPVVAELEPAPA